MKKNKTIAYMLAATLLVGGTFVGTKALFTDQIDTIGELSISTGDLDIEIDSKETTNWEIMRNGEENEDPNFTEGDEPNYGNIKPGDLLKKKVVIKNAGTLRIDKNLELSHDDKKIPNELKGFLKLSQTPITFNDKNGNGFFDPDETAEMTLVIKADGPGVHNTAKGVSDEDKAKSFNKDEIEKVTFNLNNVWTLKAKQQNTNGNAIQ
ncbi:hypothetical protein [Romboutsia timonensis]|uniref:hypothetical protein n=1 Tax=Romboutsia timonensis TaxID=1776391 RepID=UPI002A80F4AA|nr:hypothetical protein [Romboutsia timonensis]MDY3960018.1 hypothetical protein [Romboutsia timonensis]